MNSTSDSDIGYNNSQSQARINAAISEGLSHNGFTDLDLRYFLGRKQEIFPEAKSPIYCHCRTKYINTKHLLPKHNNDGSSNHNMSDIEKQQPQKKEKFFESNAGDGTEVFDQYLTGVPLYLCFSACFLTLFLIGLDQTIVTTLLETVGNKFHSYNRISWIPSGYLLTMSVLAPTWGKISIKFGRKGAVLTALALFEIGSLVCALANSMNMLIGGRVIAGIGGGGIQSLTFIIATEIVPIHRRTTIFTLLGLAFATSTVLGPIVGGALTEHVTWRWCFYINLPLGGISASFLILFFKPPKTRWTWKEKLSSLDYIGTALSAGSIVLVLLALTFGGDTYAWNSAAVICLFVFGGLLCIAFCIWNFRYSKDPIIPWHIIRVPAVLFPIITLALAFFCMMSAFVYLASYFQVIQGTSPLSTGIHLFPTIISMIIANISTGILVKKTGHIKPFAIFGSVCLIVGSGLLTLLKPHSTSSQKIGYLILPGFGLGFLFQASIFAAQLAAPKKEGSLIMTTALFNFSRSLGAAFGTTLSSAIFGATTKNYLKQQFKEHPEKFGGFSYALIFGSLSSPSLIKQLTPEVKEFVFGTFNKGIRNIFYTNLSISCLTIITSCLFSNKKIPKKEEVKTKEDREAEKREESQEVQEAQLEAELKADKLTLSDEQISNP